MDCELEGPVQSWKGIYSPLAFFPNVSYAKEILEPAIIVLKKHFTVPYKDSPLCKDSDDVYLKALLKAFFALAGLALQPAIAAVSICQAIANWKGYLNKEHKTCLWGFYSLRTITADSLSIVFCIDTLKNMIHQSFRMSIISVRIQRIPS